jgi:peptidyl-prolyl cis-trans isomerase A (cyclophilin A)
VRHALSPNPSERPEVNSLNLCRRSLLVLCAGLSVALGASAADSAAPAAAPVANALPNVVFQTSMGSFTVELYPAKAPKTVENFLEYVKSKQYEGTIFHRVIDGFMIQGGGFAADMTEKPTRAPIVLEAANGLKNERGTIAMARRGDPNSATAQFFINVVDNPALNATRPEGNGYAVFGKVVAGMDVIDKIRTVATGNKGMHQNVPLTPVLINSAKLAK